MTPVNSDKGLRELDIKDWATLAKDFVRADLLLGNGFSRNLTGHLNYQSLFEEFIKGCTPANRTVFESLGTKNFEEIQSRLINTLEINKLFGVKRNDSLEKAIQNAIQLLKNGLIESIKNKHPLSSQINKDQLRRVAAQLDNFGDVFTLNYDLFLYHIIMLMKDKSDLEGRRTPYSDYFWCTYKDGADFKLFMDHDYAGRKHVHYLHGALFLFEEPPSTIKLIRGNNATELVSLISDVINKGTMPLFVSGGKPNEKLKVINRSNYLSFVKGKLEKSKHSLVVFGASLSARDYHIVKAINYDKDTRDLAIAIHIGAEPLEKLEREKLRLTSLFKNHRVRFFDSKTLFNF